MLKRNFLSLICPIIIGLGNPMGFSGTITVTGLNVDENLMMFIVILQMQRQQRRHDQPILLVVAASLGTVPMDTWYRQRGETGSHFN